MTSEEFFPLVRRWVSEDQLHRLIFPIICNTYDIDGVIAINDTVGGLHPRYNDLVITGRSVEERAETMRMLAQKAVDNVVFMNPLPFKQKTRKSSGIHKATVLNTLIAYGYRIGAHFEDDPIQAKEIERLCPVVPVVLIKHNLTEKRNVRRPYP